MTTPRRGVAEVSRNSSFYGPTSIIEPARAVAAGGDVCPYGQAASVVLPSPARAGMTTDRDE